MNLPEGWLADVEATELQRLCKDKYVLEIGAYLGRSTVAIAQVARHVVSIDHHRGSPEHQPGGIRYDPRLKVAAYSISTLAPFMANLRAFGVADKVSVFVTSSNEAERFLRPGIFDVAFVDGQHDFESASFDISFALRSVHHGTGRGREAIVICHDYYGGEPGVKQVVDAMKPPVVAFDCAGTMRGLRYE